MKKSLSRIITYRRLPQAAVILTLSLFIAACSGIAKENSEDAAATGAWKSAYAGLLTKYVDAEGWVDYAGWAGNEQDKAALKTVTQGIAEAKLPKNKKAKLALYVNAYNAWILEKMVEGYPLEGPFALGDDFFDQEGIKVAGQTMSFNELEKELIKDVADGPGYHFIINCAAESCPKLHNAPFTKGNLDSLTEKLTTEFVNSERGVIIRDGGQKIALSKIFDWYKDDFASEDGVLPFVRKYHARNLPESVAVEYQEYSWKLNAKR